MTFIAILLERRSTSPQLISAQCSHSNYLDYRWGRQTRRPRKTKKKLKWSWLSLTAQNQRTFELLAQQLPLLVELRLQLLQGWLWLRQLQLQRLFQQGDLAKERRKKKMQREAKDVCKCSCYHSNINHFNSHCDFFPGTPFSPESWDSPGTTGTIGQKKLTKKKGTATESSWCCNLESCDKTGQGLTSLSPTQQRKSNVISRGLNETLNPRRIFASLPYIPIFQQHTLHVSIWALPIPMTQQTQSSNRSFLCSNLFLFFLWWITNL